MALVLKDYQLKALGALENFLTRARGATDVPALQQAFDAARRAALGEDIRTAPYRSLATEAPTVPQVCLRIPTGGGKTLMAAHAVELAARRLVGTHAPVVLWLVPTNIIRTQTRDALLTPGHPYREALLAHWPADRLAVIDIADCATLRAQDFGTKTIIVVGTRQTLQVRETASRDVYAYNESFDPHFSNLPSDDERFERVSQADLEGNPSLTKLLGPAGIGRVKRSFANLLAWHRPIVIVDEAHNARSDLSYEVFQRVRPACVIEWTATPATDQNVLYHVSAQELKAEDMIKLPIVLSPHPNWQEAVRDAVLTRERLAAAAVRESDYVRPIVLFQAEPANGEAKVEVLRQRLIDAHQIEPRRIAVATGTQRELDGVNLFDPTCPVDFVITVEALKEGWDCSFAYVFCTAQNIRSAKDMEQLLGRVLRLPYARRRQDEHLNRAYAHVCGSNTLLVANQLADRLVEMGFEELEVAEFVTPNQGDLLGEAPAGRPVPSPPQSAFELSVVAAEALRTAFPTGVSVTPPTDAAPNAKAIVTLTGLVPTAAIDAAVAAAPKREREEINRQIDRHQTRALAALSPAQRHQAFGAIPRFAVPLQGELALLEPALLGELLELALRDAPSDLPGFGTVEEERPYLIDVQQGHLRVEHAVAQYGLDLDRGSDALRREDLIQILDRKVRRDDILQPDMIAWLGRVLDGLMARGIEHNYIARHLNQLADALAKKLDGLLQENREIAFQRCFAEGPQKVRLSDVHAFEFDADNYPARWHYNGRYTFQKHYYGRPGELDDDMAQEETACGIELDSLEQVEFWVRNLERQPESSFWLPTSTDRFYPDFVARLKDGRFMVVEYKGADRYSNDDSKEKRDIGGVWAAASGGKCLFVMATHASVAGMSVGAQLRRAVST